MPQKPLLIVLAVMAGALAARLYGAYRWSADTRLLRARLDAGREPPRPSLAVHVHDVYANGEGLLRASPLGLVPLARVRGTEDLAKGELMCFLAESAWYPTALLPSQGVHWVAADDRSASATLTDGSTSVTMLFRFDERGLIESARAEARGRAVGGKVVPTP